jgi:hypothetical protein
MKARSSFRRLALIRPPRSICLVCLALSLLVCNPAARGEGIVAECTEAALRAALAGGGSVTFACDGVITLTNTLVISTNTRATFKTSLD